MSVSDRFLAYGRQCIDEDDIAAVTKVLGSDYLTTGPAVDQFELAFAQKMDCRHAVACSNGTAALHLAALAAGLGPGDVGIVPAITFMATANALRYVGADVVFCDVDPETGLATAETVASAAKDIAPGKLGAVLPVHYSGAPAPVAEIKKAAETSDAAGGKPVVVIEDSCHALGSVWRDGNGDMHNVGTGAASTASTYSFHPVKTIATGEGGMIATDDDALAAKIRVLRSHGIERNTDFFKTTDQARNPWFHEMHALGFNYRLSDIQAALGTSQLAKLDRFISTRAELMDRYQERLEPLSPMVRLATRKRAETTSWHLAVVLIDFAAIGIDRASVMSALKDAGIGTQVHYIPVYRQPYYQETLGKMSLPGAERFYERCLSLPLFPSMTMEDVDRVVSTLERVIHR